MGCVTDEALQELNLYDCCPMRIIELTICGIMTLISRDTKRTCFIFRCCHLSEKESCLVVCGRSDIRPTAGSSETHPLFSSLYS